MPSRKSYLSFILEQAAGAGDVSYRSMMGEYLLYVSGRLVGGIYDDRLLVKPTPVACRMLPDAPRETPYDGAKEMLLVEEVDDRDFLCALLRELGR